MSFCALLYYKRLADNVDFLEGGDWKAQAAKIHPNEKNINEQPILIAIMEKKKRIRNKWFLYVTLINNKFLVRYRKNEFSFNRIV